MNSPDLAGARFNMLLNQVRAWDVSDERVLDLLAGMPREAFVPPAYRNLAYADLMLPIGHGQVMLAPKLEARFLQALALQPSDVVLEVGAGSGYMAALMARLAAFVTTVDVVPELAESAALTLTEQSVRNVRVETGNAAEGWPDHGPYDAIMISGALPELPQPFLASLKVGGRLVAVVGSRPAMQAILVTRRSTDDWHREVLFETDVPVLQHVRAPAAFEF
jgi:protein-L-isoaspartate(D-aspartate) O-methyltransferase